MNEIPIPAADDSVEAPKLRPASRNLISILGTALIVSLVINSVLDVDFTETGIYFVMIPGLLAILLSILPGNSDRTSFGLFRGTMIAILASAILVREGFICVVMASPLIFLVVALVSFIRSSAKSARIEVAVAIPLLLLLGGTEGIFYEFDSRIVVEEVRTIDITADALTTSLALPGELPELEPLLFALPFPEPTTFEGEGLEVGDTRLIDFDDGGMIELEITNVADDSITWTFVETTTSLNEWMELHTATVSWVETSSGLELTVEVEFDRLLAPAFYFDPLQRFGVGELAEVLADMIEHNAEALDTDALEGNNV